jgi:hypothetical protein
MQQRTRWARSIDKTIADAKRSILLREFRPLTQPSVVAAAEPALLAIAEVLRDEHQSVRPAALDELRCFLTDTTSRLYGDNPISARWAAEQLRQRFIQQPPATGSVSSDC